MHKHKSFSASFLSSVQNVRRIALIFCPQDLEYWGIDELLLEPCCALKYYPEIELCFKEVEGEEQSRMKQAERKANEDFGHSRVGRARKWLWNLTEYPETSLAAQVRKPDEGAAMAEEAEAQGPTCAQKVRHSPVLNRGFIAHTE